MGIDVNQTTISTPMSFAIRTSSTHSGCTADAAEGQARSASLAATVGARPRFHVFRRILACREAPLRDMASVVGWPLRFGRGTARAFLKERFFDDRWRRKPIGALVPSCGFPR